MAQLDPNECAVLLQFLRTCEVTLKGDLIPVVASSMHKMEATVIAAREEQELQQKATEQKNKGQKKAASKAEAPFG